MRYAILIVLCGVVTYWNSRSGPFIFDDDLSVVTNAQIQQVWPLSRFFSAGQETAVASRPVVNLSLALNYAIGGLDVRIYHAWNIAVHLLCALLLFGIVRRTLEFTGSNRLRQGYGGPPKRHAKAEEQDPAYVHIAFACALIWMLHPLQTEAVDYITQRTESMMGLFYLLTLYAALRAVDAGTTWRMLSVAACALGMASKESMVTAPLMVVLYDRIFIFGSMKQAWRARWPLYTGLATTWLVLAALARTTPGYRTAGFSTDISPWTYLLNQSVIIVEYLRRIVWPRSLVLDYGLPRAVTLDEVMPYAVVVLLLLALTIAALIRRPKLGFLGAWFFVTLAPTSSILPIATEVGAERRMYLPLAALVVLGVVAVDSLAQRKRAREQGIRWHRASVLSGIALLTVSVALAAGTMLRNREYRSGISIARTVVERRPHGRAHHLLAVELMKAGQREEALMHLREAVKEDPSAHYSLGVELFHDGQFSEAISQLSEFVRRPLEAPEKNFTALTNLGIALAGTGKANEAISAFRRALDVDPRNPDAHRNLAKALQDTGDLEGAALHARQALALRPGDADVHNLLGAALASQQKLDEAVVQFQQALQVDPGNAEARQNLEQALLEQKRSNRR